MTKHNNSIFDFGGQQWNFDTLPIITENFIIVTLVSPNNVAYFEISRDDDATWVLSGEKLMKLFNMTNFDRDESVMKFARQLRGMGVDEALRARGAKDGDLVRIGKFEFEFVD